MKVPTHDGNRWEGSIPRADIRHNDTKRTRYVTKENRGTQ